MIIDISSYNGKIDFQEMYNKESIERIIMRSTTKNNKLDTRLIQNVNGAIAAGIKNIDFYKFSYARNYGDAAHECTVLIARLRAAGIINFFDTMWLDLEDFDGRSYTMSECSQVIAGYKNVLDAAAIPLGIYCNYNYAKNILPDWAQVFPLWLARWSRQTGDVSPFKIVYWQYTNSGKCSGIVGDVDLSKAVY